MRHFTGFFFFFFFLVNFFQSLNRLDWTCWMWQVERWNCQRIQTRIQIRFLTGDVVNHLQEPETVSAGIFFFFFFSSSKDCFRLVPSHCAMFGFEGQLKCENKYAWRNKNTEINYKSFAKDDQSPCVLTHRYQLPTYRWFSPNVKKDRKHLLAPSVYPDPHENLMGSILSRDPSFVQVLWKSAQ